MATETFTLTLDDHPDTGVSVTINDTSQTVQGQELRYITGLGTYDRRSFALGHGDDDTLVLWDRGARRLYPYIDLADNGGTQITTATTTTNEGVDQQGWYQICMGGGYVYVGRPLSQSNNAGRLDVYSITNGVLGSPGVGSPNTGTGYLSSNNFGYYKLASPGLTSHVVAQDGYTGHRVNGIQSVRNISPNGANIFTLTSGSTTRFTRGITCLSTGPGNSFLTVTGRTPSGNSVTLNGYWNNPPSGGIDLGGSITVTGASAEVARHNRLFYCHDSSGATAGEYFVATSGLNAGMQIHRIREGASSLAFQTVWTDNDFDPLEGNYAIQQVKNPAGDVGACMIKDGVVYGITYDSTQPGSSRISIAEEKSLIASSYSSSAQRGLACINDAVMAWTGNSALQIHKNNFFKTTFVPDYTIRVERNQSGSVWRYVSTGNDRTNSVWNGFPRKAMQFNLGDSIRFKIDSHEYPFYIKTANTTGTGDQAQGVANAGIERGYVEWTPTAAGTYYYVSSAYSDMGNTITIV